MRGEDHRAVAPGTLPVPLPMAYEQALLVAGRAMGKGGKATVTEAKTYLRGYGVSGLAAGQALEVPQRGGPRHDVRGGVG